FQVGTTLPCSTLEGYQFGETYPSGPVTITSAGLSSPSSRQCEFAWAKWAMTVSLVQTMGRRDAAGAASGRLVTHQPTPTAATSSRSSFSSSVRLNGGVYMGPTVQPG